MKISVRMTLFNFFCLFTLTILVFSVFYGFSQRSILTSEKEELIRRSQAGGMRMMHGLMARGRSFPGDFLVGSWENGAFSVIQNPWDLNPSLWKEGMVFEGGEYYLFIPFERSGIEFLIGKNISPSIRSLERIRFIAWYLIPILAAIGMVVGYFLSEYWLRPLRDLNRKLYEIKSEDLSERFSVGTTPDEIEELKFALNKMLQSFEQGYLIQKRFVSNVSHQLRTPLSSIIGYVQMLRRWGDADVRVRHEALTAIETAASEMKDLTENLLLLSQTDQNIAKAIVNVDQIIQPIIEYWQNKNPDRELHLRVLSSPKIITSVGHFKILVDVLLDNAFKYSPKEIEVIIGEKEIVIRDYGPGMPTEVQTKLGERFLRGRNATGKPGWGIGLALAFEIANKLGLKLSFGNVIDGEGLEVKIDYQGNRTSTEPSVDEENNE